MTFNQYMRWDKRSATKDTLGQEVETFSTFGYLWANIERTNGRNQVDYGAKRTGEYATITIHNTPALSALDRLTFNSQTWIIDSIVRNENELVCDAWRFDVQVG